MSKHNSIKQLQQQNNAYRKELEGLLKQLNPKDKKWAWELINGVVENELQQEELCNE